MTLILKIDRIKYVSRSTAAAAAARSDFIATQRVRRLSTLGDVTPAPPPHRALAAPARGHGQALANPIHLQRSTIPDYKMIVKASTT